MLLASEQLTISGGHKDTAQLIVHLLEKRALAPVDARRLTLRPFEGAGGVVTPSPLPATRAAFDAMRRGRPSRTDRMQSSGKTDRRKRSSSVITGNRLLAPDSSVALALAAWKARRPFMHHDLRRMLLGVSCMRFQFQGR